MSSLKYIIPGNQKDLLDGAILLLRGTHHGESKDREKKQKESVTCAGEGDLFE